MNGLLSLMTPDCVSLQGFDVEGDDPREIVQNIVFGSQYEGCRDEMNLVSLVPPLFFGISCSCHLPIFCYNQIDMQVDVCNVFNQTDMKLFECRCLLSYF